MLVMDAYSKWPSVVRMPIYPTTETTTMALDILFTAWVCPMTIVSDNGPQFGSMQFEDWCRLHGIVHLTSAPFHPPSNGEAERLVGVFKTCGVPWERNGKGNTRLPWLSSRLPQHAELRHGVNSG